MSVIVVLIIISSERCRPIRTAIYNIELEFKCWNSFIEAVVQFTIRMGDSPASLF